MTKNFLIIFLMLVLLPSIFAFNIAYVAEKPNALDQNDIFVRDWLIKNGHKVTVIGNSAFNADAYNIIIVSSTVYDIQNTFDNTKHKTLFFSGSAAKKAGLSLNSGKTVDKNAEIIDLNSPITKDLGRGLKQFYSSATDVNYLTGCKAANSGNLIVTRTSDTNSVVFTVDTNSLLIDTSCSDRDKKIYQRNLFFGFTKATLWSSITEQTFKNSITWLSIGLPFDNDKDGYDTTSPGENGDDGKEKDCNDNDASVYPGASDVYKNCKNDAPIITENITKITVKEGETAVVEIKAVDPEGDTIIYTVNDNKFVQDSTNKNIFRWKTGFFDSGKYSFAATVSDGSLKSSTNFDVEVYDINSPPQCSKIPDITFNEDETFSLNFNSYCSNSDDDPLNYTINESFLEDKIKVSFEGSVVKFSTVQDWYGDGWIIFGVSDGKESILTNKISIKINSVNDKPVLSLIFPKDNTINIVSGNTKLFRVDANDPDNDKLVMSWKLGEEVVGYDNSYLFNKSEGYYDLKIIANDGKLSSENSWKVYVKSISEYNCEDVNGFICSENQVCGETFLGVKDSSSCCPVSCIDRPPKFEDVSDKCKNINSSIEISFEDLNQYQQFKTGDKINFKIKIKNNLDKLYKFNVKSYLYDTTKEDNLGKYSGSLDVQKGETNTLNFEISVPDKIKESDSFAVYIFAEGGKDSCNTVYRRISLNRKDNNIVITSFEIPEEDISCGDYISANLRVKNYGLKDHDVYLKIINSELSIDQRSDDFSLEKYGSDDTQNENFIIKIPDNAKAGEYELEAEAYYDGNKYSIKKKLSLGECIQKTVAEKKSEAIRIIGIPSEITNIKPLDFKKIIISTTLVVILFFYLVFFYILKVYFVK